MRRTSEGINNAAVARVIAEYLWESGLRPDTDTELPRKLRDRVGRALSGTSLSVETLNWFIDAFQLEPALAENLRGALAGADQAWW